MEYRWQDESSELMPAPGGVLLSSFPSAGLAATVASHYIIRTLQLPRTAIFDSSEVAPVAIVQGGQVNPAVRVYGRKDLGLVLSEVPALPSNIAALTQAILDGAEKRGARLVLGLEGVVPHPTTDEEESPDEKVWVATSRRDPVLDKLFAGANAHPLDEGVIGGVSGALLVAGITRKIPVAVLMVSAQASVGFPDHRAGAVLIEALDRLLPELAIDTRPLRSQAEAIEKALRSAMRQQSKTKGETASVDETDRTMYQ